MVKSDNASENVDIFMFLLSVQCCESSSLKLAYLYKIYAKLIMYF